MSSPYATKCWACGSSNYKESVTFEICHDCGIEFRYHGKGGNDKYYAAKQERDERHRREEEEDFKKFHKEWWGIDDD